MRFVDEQPFLDAIAVRPHDDGLRLVYADFLEEAGDPDRADLVRVQVAIERTTEDHPRRAELANRANDLLAANRERWTEHLRDLVLEADFRRGVLDAVAVDAAAFLAKGEELFRRVAVRRVRLRDLTAVLEELLASPLLARVRELDLCDNALGNEGVRLAASSPHLRELEVLDLGYNGIDDAGVRLLARSSSLPAMTALSLGFNERITSAGVAELAASPFLGGLMTLDLSSNAIDEAGIQAIVASPTLRQLHRLRISENRIGDAGAAALAQSTLLQRMLSRITRLELRDNRIGPSGARALASCPLMTRCLALDLTRNSIEDSGLAAIVESEHLRGLRVLKVGRNQITDAGIAGLRPHWPRVFAQLRLLDLSENRLTQLGLNELDRYNASGAVTLDVSRNVQAASGDASQGPTPAAIDDVAAAAELKRRVAHPASRANTRPGNG